MRLWSLDPRYLDPRGLVALWREALLARKVLEERTRGYRNHPQLIRFRNHRDPISMINAYLHQIYLEAVKRGYKFSREKIPENPPLPEENDKIPVTIGQLIYEAQILIVKINARDPKWLAKLLETECFEPNPVFRVVQGFVEPWEKINNSLLKQFRERFPEMLIRICNQRII